MPVTKESQIVGVPLPRTCVRRIDALAREQRRSRADFLRILILDGLPPDKNEPAGSTTGDEGGDGAEHKMTRL